MTNNIIVKDGKLVPTKEPAKPNGKPSKYPFPTSQYDALLKLAKAAGVDVGTSKAQNSKAVNAVTRAVLEDFIVTQNKPKTE